jgi:hypothetical protein
MKIFFSVDAVEYEQDDTNKLHGRRVVLKLVQCADCKCLLLAEDMRKITVYDTRLVCPRCYDEENGA